MHLRRSLIPISIYIRTNICKVKNRVYCNDEMHCWNTSSRDSKCFCVLSTQKAFVSASSWSQINSDTRLIRPSFRINLIICKAQMKKLAGGNKCALRVIDQSSNKNLTLSNLFWSFLKYFFHCFGRCCSLFSILTCIVQSNAFLFSHSRDFIDPGFYWSVTEYTTFLFNTLLKTNSERHQMRSTILR